MTDATTPDQQHQQIVPVILAGGVGSRLWPISRQHYPKQFHRLIDGYSLLQNTLLRADAATKEAPIIVCNEEHRFLVAQQCREVGIAWRSITLETVGRSSAPAIALAAWQLMHEDPQKIMLVLSSDHLVDDEAAFTSAVSQAEIGATSGGVVTFGIKPTRAETAFGYIEISQSNSELQPAKSFVEKPSQDVAAEYLSSGRYLWNSGMFVVTAQTYLDELTAHAPTMALATQTAIAQAQKDLDFVRPSEAFANSPSGSVDYTVMEKTDRAMVVPVSFKWNDVGSWEAIWNESLQDEDGNHTRGDVEHLDTRNSLVYASERLVCTLGVDNLVVVETADAVLVAGRERVQDVKAFVEKLQDSGRQEHLHHQIVHRPWGSYEAIAGGDSYQVKCIRVSPGQSLSLQLHHHRSEHWVVVEGIALVTRADEQFTLSANESAYIPQGVKHRLQNPGKLDLELIEVQVGPYLGEDDIQRFDDIYGRFNTD